MRFLRTPPATPSRIGPGKPFSIRQEGGLLCRLLSKVVVLDTLLVPNSFDICHADAHNPQSILAWFSHRQVMEDQRAYL